MKNWKNWKNLFKMLIILVNTKLNVNLGFYVCTLDNIWLLYVVILVHVQVVA